MLGAKKLIVIRTSWRVLNSENDAFLLRILRTQKYFNYPIPKCFTFFDLDCLCNNLQRLNFVVVFSFLLINFNKMKILLDSMIFVLLRKTFFFVPKGYIIPHFLRLKLKFTRRRRWEKKYRKGDDIFFRS